jgi:hypothetical protein
LAGCASGPKYGAIKSTISPIQADKSRITFYREAGLGGIVAVLRVYVDGVVVGSVPKGSVLSVDRAAGKHAIRFEREGILGIGQVDFEIDAEGGKQYFVELPPQPGCPIGAFYCLMADQRVEPNDHCGADGWCGAVRSAAWVEGKLNDLAVQTPRSPD